MIPILKLLLALATVLGVVVRGQNLICDGNFERNQLQNAAQQALDAIGSTRRATASHELADRGQHVFNNNLLKFPRSVLEDLLKDVGGYEQLNNLIEDLKPLSQTQQDAISNKMVAHFSQDELYVDYNAALYGEYVRQLRQALVEYLKAYTSDNGDNRRGIHEIRQQVRNIASEMANHDVYVDPMARNRWLLQNQDRAQVYYQDSADLPVFVQAELAEEVIKIYILRDNDGAISDVGVVIEGITVLRNLGNLSRACCYLLGLTYALDLRYPKTHKYSLEVFQKLFLDLDPSRLSVKQASAEDRLCGFRQDGRPLERNTRGSSRRRARSSRRRARSNCCRVRSTSPRAHPSSPRAYSSP
ncbi:uncharacterized protein LOC125262708 [Megalobrama amblycephala]|uniref:uncharacterized protein LOC125262708 n=1 Tax=Megalobrama amblycephala TaxID=75352 RepID=UPI00201403D3|nr:uncharacterized protein LOC125262708 [Megalobrama amblycephala]